MNCKQGDLAVIVEGPRNVGRFVNVLEPSAYHGAGWWYVESAAGPLLGTYPVNGKEDIGTLGHIEDRRLRPIRDPGEDARDETLEWLPVPTKHTEAA